MDKQRTESPTNLPVAMKTVWGQAGPLLGQRFPWNPVSPRHAAKATRESASAESLQALVPPRHTAPQPMGPRALSPPRTAHGARPAWLTLGWQAGQHWTSWFGSERPQRPAGRGRGWRRALPLVGDYWGGQGEERRRVCRPSPLSLPSKPARTGSKVRLPATPRRAEQRERDLGPRAKLHSVEKTPRKGAERKGSASLREL